VATKYRCSYTGSENYFISMSKDEAEDEAKREEIKEETHELQDIENEDDVVKEEEEEI
jgi:hypothetical protein